MRYITTILIFLISINLPVDAQTVYPDYIDGQVHFKLTESSSLELDPYQNDVPALNLIFTNFGVDTIFKPFPLPGTDLDKVYRLHFSQASNVDQLITELELLTFVEFAEKISLFETTFTPDDIQAGQYSLDLIQAELAWDVTTGSQDVVIAVVDNAVNLDHEDLAANIWTNEAEANGLPGVDDDLNGYVDDVNGYDVSDGDNDPNPPPSADNNSAFIHGSHVSGIASAATNNGTGMASIGFNCHIMPVKAAPDNSGGSALPNAQDGVFYAMQSGADIINMSWGSFGSGLVTGLIMQQANNNGIVLVSSAGNDDSQDEFYPAAYSYVLSVAATDQNDQKAGFSNYGPSIDVAAPGVNIYSTLIDGDNTYGNLSGTSMSAPLVSGLAGLVLSDDTSQSNDQVRQRIINGCDNIDTENPNYQGQLGAGRINAFQSLSPTSTNLNIKKSGLSFYPNPVTKGQSVNLKFEEPPTGVFTITVIDLSGKTLWSKQVSANGRSQFNMNKLANFASGSYFIQLQLGDNAYNQKLIIH